MTDRPLPSYKQSLQLPLHPPHLYVHHRDLCPSTIPDQHRGGKVVSSMTITQSSIRPAFLVSRFAKKPTNHVAAIKIDDRPIAPVYLCPPDPGSTKTYKSTKGQLCQLAATRRFTHVREVECTRGSFNQRRRLTFLIIIST